MDATRMGTGEPVCGHTQHKGMRHCTLRSQKQVDAQWKLSMRGQNIEKIANDHRAT